MQSYIAAIKDPPRFRCIPDLKPCPFCGGKARLRTANIFMDTGYRVECSTCGINTSLVLPGHYINWHGKEDFDMTDEQAVQEAINAWNYRKEDTTE